MNLFFDVSFKIDDILILDCVKSQVSSGSCLTIMGPSGAGKSTLLNILSLKSQNQTGELLYNGQNLSQRSNSKEFISQVEQEDLFQPTLTVREHMQIQSGLKLHYMSKDEQEAKVLQVLTRLRLNEAYDTHISDLSGGEKKRLSIAEELLSDKEVFFLDEPTTGLDSQMADQVIELVHQIAAEAQKTIIYTIHQPSYKIYNKFTNILFIVKGKVFQTGGIQGLQQHCSNFNIQIPKFANPTEYLLEQFQNLPEDIKNYNFRADEPEFIKNYCEILPKKEISTANIFVQYYYLTYRSFLVKSRNKTESKLTLLNGSLLGLLIGLLFQQVPVNSSSISSRNGAIYFLQTCPIFQSQFRVIVSVVSTITQTKREIKTKGIQNSTAQWASLTTVDIPMQIIAYVIIFLGISFFLIGLSDDLQQFVQVALVCACGVLISSSYGYMISTLSTDFAVVVTISVIVLLPLFMNQANMMNKDSIPWLLSWTHQVSPFRVTSDLQYKILWDGLDIECDQNNCRYPNGNEQLEKGMNIKGELSDLIQWNGINIFLMIVISRTIGYLRMIMQMDQDDDYRIILNSIGCGGSTSNVKVKIEGKNGKYSDNNLDIQK